MHDEAEANIPYLWGARALMLAIVGLNLWLIAKAWRRHERSPAAR
jgi:hypothetical protein